MNLDRRQFLHRAGLGTLAVAGAGALGACGGGDTSSDGTMTLDFPTWQGDEAGVKTWWRQAIASFQQTHPKVTIKLQQVPFATYTDTLTSRFSAGKAPDIVHLPTTTFGSFAAQGWLANLDDRLKGTDILGNWTKVQKTMMWDGHNVGLLVLGYAPVLYYNEKLLKDAGVAVPTTFPELIAAAAKLTSGGVYGYGATTTSHPGTYSEATWMVYGAGGGWSAGEKLRFTDPAVVKAMDDYRTLARYSPKGVPSEQKRTLFFDGKIAMMIEGPFVYAGLDKAAASVKSHVKLAKAPFVQQPGYPSNSIHVSTQASKKKADMAWEFIKSLTTPQTQASYAQLYGVPSPRRGAVTQAMIDKRPELGLFQSVTDSAVDATPDNKDIVTNFSEVQKLIMDACVRLQTSSTPTATVMADLQNKVNGAIK
ncbi:ABC transporter substrate-binding protein [Actinoallomurus iriomotensis]|uniref:ABC transporter substrate-binding protein n=1 Tax=Actinoallomurus iriomotensis TaxID=478107 RepID=A0A9W6RDR2_9ACTN|nr:sugar ABC transporter substrate-binding protein [Actinoallomurus iriomotensis]GLY73969.1 ABC transporter substrate-binding protein [Actinoallomurus iriomotensis]